MSSTEQIRAALGRSRRWVVKVGTALTTNEGVGLNLPAIRDWVEQIAELQADGREIVVVTSGSVAEGAARLGWKKRPHVLNQLQAAAAIGQMGLMRGWDRACEAFGRSAAQILLTHEDLSDRQRYLNARNTLWTLLDLGVLPIVNENDTVATAEISLGDNDTLAGLVCNLIEADLLVVLTDQAGLMNADPRQVPDAELIGYAEVDASFLDRLAGDGGSWGRGGMRTKLRAARLAGRSATSTIIASGREPGVLRAIATGNDVGSLLHSTREKVAARKQWLGGTIKARGRLTLDAGACKALAGQGKSLLPVGVTAVEGDFSRGELVVLLEPAGTEIGRGLVNYGASECRRIAGRPSQEIEAVLGYVREPELIHRDNLLLGVVF